MKKDKLHNTETRIDFRANVEDNRVVRIYYLENNEDRIITDNWDEEKTETYPFSRFLITLCGYYERLAKSEGNSIYGEFVEQLREYKLVWRKFFSKHSKDLGEIEVYIERYVSLIQNMNDKPLNNTEEKLSLKQKVIVLEYLGVLTALNPCQQDQQKVKIISAITGNSSDNVKKALANNSKIVERGSLDTKTKKNLQVVRDFLKDHGLTELADKVQESINRITKR